MTKPARNAVELLAQAHEQSRVVQCACGRSATWRTIAELVRAGWEWVARGLPVKFRWVCPDCKETP